MKPKLHLLLAILLFLGSISLEAQSNASQSGAMEKRSDNTLREIVAKNFPKNNVFVGGTTSFYETQKALGKLMAQEYRYITPENDFKQSYIHPQPNVWRWDRPDKWLEYAAENNQYVRIHGPISPQCSNWTMQDDRTAEELEQNLDAFMTALCKRYNGHPNVLWMDVINETVNPDGSWKKAEPGIKWEMPWEKMGYEYGISRTEYPHLEGSIPKYIIQAFRIATAHAPDTKLVINQHIGMEAAAWNKIKDMVSYLRAIGCRVDGIGWQAHIKLTRDDASQWETGAINLNELSELIDWAHANDLEFHVTENNIHVNKHEAQNEDEYSNIFTGIVKALLEKRHTGVVTWNIWNMNDKQHFKRDHIKLIGLWDENLQPKKGYYDIQELLKNPPAVK